MTTTDPGSRSRARAAESRVVRWTLVALVVVGALGSVLWGTWLGGRAPVEANLPGSGSLGFAVAAVRLLVDGLGALVIGAGALPLLLPGGGLAPRSGRRLPGGVVERARRAAGRGSGRLALAAGACWAIAAAVELWLQASDAVGGSPFALRPSTLLRYGTEVAAGRGLLLTGVCAVLVMAVQVVRHRFGDSGAGRRCPEFSVGAAVLGILPGAVTGHAGAHASQDPAVLAITLHVVAASCWVGGLFAVAIVARNRPVLFGLVLPRFSGVAGYCAVLVLVSGVLSAAFRLPSLADLTGTGYGRLILMKTAVLSVLLGLGWRARRVLLPRAAALAGRAGSGKSTVPVARWLGGEMTLMAVVLGLAAALAGSAP
ncbi:copper resistance D family protein [Pseudonocardia spinosispora]|uniref:copper resistance D family protein n=1 Tax=Pseudonocardia spinosispora TaxID=103441 RepID=UPI00041023F1|nr:CopD family protein [Pseudonocardia spinosispora]